MNKLLEQLRACKCANLILYLIFVATIYLQCIFFNDSFGFNRVYEGYKIAIAMLIASPVFLFRGKSWMIWFSVFINIWGRSNLVYYRANAVLIDASVLDKTIYEGASFIYSVCLSFKSWFNTKGFPFR